MNKGDICVQEFVRVADFLLKSGKVRIHRKSWWLHKECVKKILCKPITR